MPDTLHEERRIAVSAVRRAAAVCRVVRQRMVSPETIQKKDRSPVTVADFASQAVVCSILGNAFPSDAIVGEESAAALREPAKESVRNVVVAQVSAAMGSQIDPGQVMDWIDRGGADPRPGAGGRYWTLDPIDGTKGFLRGDQYVVALALIEQGQVVLGVLGCPNLPFDASSPAGAEADGSLLVAQRGQGAELLPFSDDAPTVPAGQSVRVSDVTDASAARFCESVESEHSDQSTAQKIGAALGITSAPLRMDSQAKYAVLARGQASIYLRLPTRGDYQEKIWDHAAGKLIVEEAGGRVTDVTGAPLDFSRGKTLAANSGVVATNGALHDAVIAAVRTAMGA